MLIYVKNQLSSLADFLRFYTYSFLARLLRVSSISLVCFPNSAFIEANSINICSRFWDKES